MVGLSDRKTLRAHYREELEKSAGVFEADLERCFGQRVLAPDCPPALLIFAAKVRLGYREQVPIDPERKKPEDMTLDELRQRIADVARRERDERESVDAAPSRVRAAVTGAI